MRSLTTNFFEAQRRLRRRSMVLIGGFFALLWLVVNGLLAANLHTEQVCRPGVACESTFHLHAVPLVVTALVVAAYLTLAAFLTGRALVSGPNVTAAVGPDTAVLRNVVAEVA